MKINFRKREEKEHFDLSETLKNMCKNEKITVDEEKFTEKKNIKISYFKREEVFSFSQFKKAA